MTMIPLRTLNCYLIRRISGCIGASTTCGYPHRCLPLQTRLKSSGAPESATQVSTNDEEEDLKKEKLKERQRAATDKLNSLLTSLEVDKPSDTATSSILGKLNLNLAKPSKKRKKDIKAEKKTKEETKKEEVKEEKQEEKKDGLETELADAAKAVATSLGGDVEKTESELLQRLKQHSQSEKAISFSPDLFEGMKIESTKIDDLAERSGSFARASSVHKQLGIQDEKEKLTPKTILKYQALNRKMTKIDLFGSGSLNIFTKQKEDLGEKPEFPELKTWDELQNENLESLVTFAPANGFEEMIIWTKQNKVWKFPIDNEQDIGEEASVGFHEHIFLEKLLNEGFPKKGPVRHYMELVTTGLSKNPYMSIKEKRAHIVWYREYFQAKIDILKDLGIDE